MKNIVFITVVFLVFCSSAYGQFDCKVLTNNLEGQYNGECKKGLANGEGSAKGVDTYRGEFKKGYPNGFGVYTFKNGSNYIGHFRKGKKDGYGLLNTISEAGGLSQDYGLWLADSLIIPNDSKALFKVKYRKGIKLIDPRLNRDKAVKNQVWVNFFVNGVPDKTVLVSKAEISSGKQLDTKKRSLNTLVAFDEIKEFPVTFKLIYQIQKVDQLFPVDCVAEVTLLTRGLWEIDVNH
jgi:hypothetical protein